jgi:hypothetical protein
MSESLVTGWDNFYIMIGSSAAGLMGLTFVVIALAADAQRVSDRGLRAFITPTIGYFGTVLAFAAFLTVPRQSLWSLSLGFGAVGLSGLIYTTITAASMRKIGSAYVPVREDWIWHVIAPIVVYAIILAMAWLIWRMPAAALYGIAAASTLLLFIGIHNAWDVATSISLRKAPDS